ncbi:type III-A CRISPR-associated protein Cas10/Csm1 [Tetragenococcus halophilus]|uniref:type III-A CRISPR-associated protein Cas10/Csm1 n=1 Tax=Tetragenococcus halophilus TaxID=51669 RepID=UPI0025662AAE|nr:type III-A CRISPR-associated protein Cas10/Csm1 [Tetragenococcus halophilus]GMG69744.1 type III-A CRISPR-associated protein Cas10/Csm1 [Tetragenococcus halophilus]
MDKQSVDLFYGSLLHDIGKIVQRATQEKKRHTEIGAQFMKDYLSSKNILDQIKFHHYKELSNANIEDQSQAYIAYIADNIASGLDRREHNDEVKRKWNSQMNLEDIFSKFGSKPTKRFIQPRILDLDVNNIFPSENYQEFTSGEYAGILQKIKEAFTRIEFTENYMQSTLNLLEATASFIPSSTNMQEAVDISLYDHLKMTAGFSQAIFQYLTDQSRLNFKQELFENSRSFYKEKAFLLVSFDISGIQDFIYTITSKGAHKQLRSRSFYLDMISGWIIDDLLENCSLTRANLLYSGGGHAYLFLPNTKEMLNEIEKIESGFNQFFLKNFGTQLYVIFGYTTFCANEIMEGNRPKDYQDIFHRVSNQISQKKLHRYSADEIKSLNQGGKRSGRECAICHNTSQLVEDEGQDKCELCYRLEHFSRNIQEDDFFEINDQDTQYSLPIGPNAFLHQTSRKNIENHHFSGKVYAKNQLYTGLDQATHLWVADYSDLDRNEFSHYAQREWTQQGAGASIGIKRTAVLRCDVDDLGFGFMAGFSEQDGGRYNTFSRTATFSRNMSIFFKCYINQFAEEKHLTIVYAGGDDVFIIGAWDDIIEFSVQLREYFIRWTNGKLTLSTGIGLFADKTPINIMARQTGELEDAAKDSGKDSIACFSDYFTFGYDTFIQEIYYGKLAIIRDFFAQENERGKSFIYKLLSLIRERDETDRITFARLAYYLARLEDTARNKENFRIFKQKMHDWFEDSEQIRQTELALLLYVYEIRKD